MIFQRIWTRIAKKLYFFCDFSGGEGGLDPLSPPLDPHMLSFLKGLVPQEEWSEWTGTFFLPGFSSDKDICDITLYAMDVFHEEHLHVYNGTTGKSKFSCIAKVL